MMCLFAPTYPYPSHPPTLHPALHIHLHYIHTPYPPPLHPPLHINETTKFNETTKLILHLNVFKSGSLVFNCVVND